MNRNVLIIVSLAAVVLVTGCATMQTYEGPKLRRDEVAVIKSETLGTILDTAYIGEIDGKDIGFMQTKAEVLPGDHTVKVIVTTGLGYQQYIGNKTLYLSAEAGRTYKVHGKIRRGDTWAWITDEKTEEIVAGEKGEARKEIIEEERAPKEIAPKEIIPEERAAEKVAPKETIAEERVAKKFAPPAAPLDKVVIGVLDFEWNTQCRWRPREQKKALMEELRRNTAVKLVDIDEENSLSDLKRHGYLLAERYQKYYGLDMILHVSCGGGHPTDHVDYYFSFIDLYTKKVKEVPIGVRVHDWNAPPELRFKGICTKVLASQDLNRVLRAKRKALGE